MHETHAATEAQHEPGQYQIRIKGHLDQRWAEQFEDMIFTYERDGTTILTGPVVDQAALHGLLRKVRDLGLTLVSVLQVDPTLPNRLDRNTDTDQNHSTKEHNP